MDTLLGGRRKENWSKSLIFPERDKYRAQDQFHKTFIIHFFLLPFFFHLCVLGAEPWCWRQPPTAVPWFVLATIQEKWTQVSSDTLILIIVP